MNMPTFGEPAPAKDLYAYFGSTVQKVVDAAHTLLPHHTVASLDEERV